MSQEVLREHKKISDEIDDVYMATVAGCTDVQVFLTRPKGNPSDIFFRFYTPFYELFQYTYQCTELKTLDKATTDEIWKWFRTKPPQFSSRNSEGFYRHASQGLQHFQKFQNVLIVSAVVSIKRG